MRADERETSLMDTNPVMSRKQLKNTWKMKMKATAASSPGLFLELRCRASVAVSQRITTVAPANPMVVNLFRRKCSTKKVGRRFIVVPVK